MLINKADKQIIIDLAFIIKNLFVQPLFDRSTAHGLSFLFKPLSDPK